MIKEIKSRINKPVFLISAVAGGILWFFCNYLYSTYRLKIAGFLMIPALCTFLIYSFISHYMDQFCCDWIF